MCLYDNPICLKKQHPPVTDRGMFKKTGGRREGRPPPADMRAQHSRAASRRVIARLPCQIVQRGLERVLPHGGLYVGDQRLLVGIGIGPLPPDMGDGALGGDIVPTRRSY